MFGLGNKGGLQIQVDIHPNQQGLGNGKIVPLDHVPSWKIGKSTFSPSVLSKHQGAIVTPPQQQQPSNAMEYGHSNYSYGAPIPEIIYVYDADQDIQGVVHLILPPGKSYEHLGIKIQVLGRIKMSHAAYEGRAHYDFVSLLKELQPPGTLYQTQTSIPFYFSNVEKQHETYHGRNVSVCYYVRVLVERKFFAPVKKDHEFIVQKRVQEPRVNEGIKMEVGIEECLHIEFEFEKKNYHLKDCIVGKVNFVVVRIKIKYMELAVIRRESSGEGLLSQAHSGMGAPTAGDSNGQILTETQTLTRYEIMDGAPVKGEIIPVRLFLGGIPTDLTPTFDAGNNRFTVRYYINLVLVDEVDRRYFKQQEIILWRKDLG